MAAAVETTAVETTAVETATVKSAIVKSAIVKSMMKLIVKIMIVESVVETAAEETVENPIECRAVALVFDQARRERLAKSDSLESGGSDCFSGVDPAKAPGFRSKTSR